MASDQHKLAHFFFSDFNVRKSHLLPSEAWIQHRLSLYARFTAPCIESQTARNFEWLVFIHPDTPADVRERLQRGNKWIHLEETKTVWPELYAERALARVRPGTTHLMTTVLDTDDGVSTDYVAKAQGLFHGQDLEVINFRLGLIHDLQQYYAADSFNAPYWSVICDINRRPLVHACSVGHAKMQQLGTKPMQFPSGRRIAPPEQWPLYTMWLQVVHGANLSNYARGGVCEDEVLISRFAIDKDVLVERYEK